jgi:hypothetical protein
LARGPARCHARSVEERARAWTLEEANEALPWVNELVERAQKLWADFRATSVTGLRLVRQNGHGVVPADPKPIQECIDELAAEGVVLRDIERGLVDFPARTSDGRWYWLCWLHGEDRVAWWHWLDAGFAGRLPLD